MDKTRAKRIVGELSGKFLGEWEVGKLIDNGKSALVVETKDKSGQRAALKIFDPELVEESSQEVQLSRIKTERNLIGKEHPHLIKILDGGRSEQLGYFYVVMEYFLVFQLRLTGKREMCRKDNKNSFQVIAEPYLWVTSQNLVELSVGPLRYSTKLQLCKMRQRNVLGKAKRNNLF